jgi:hypothetical protein
VVAIAYATPTIATAQPGLVTDVGSGDLIRYRTLERADFRNTERPPEALARTGNYELAATTCVYLRTDRDVSMHVGSIVGPDGNERYEGSLGHLRFEALMDRGCSWWSSRGRDAAYTLQHEQIHFAIREIAARRMNRAADELIDSLHVTGDSEEQVVEQLKARIGELFETHNAAAVERNRNFDEETSWGRNDERQQEWWREIERELRETVAWR